MTNNSAGQTQSEQITVDLDNPAHGGSVIARVDGHVIFVTGGLPGEKQVTVDLDPPAKSKSKSSFRTGQTVSIGEPSAHRVASQCEAAKLGAGCCDLDFVDAEGSLEFKRSVVLDQLKRIGKIELPEDRINAQALEPSQGWRTRVRLGVNPAGQAGVRKKNSHEIVPLAIATCAQWAPGLVEGLEEHTFANEAQVAVALGDDGTRSVVELTGSRTNPQRRILDETKSISHRVNCGAADVTWDLPADAFWQGHKSAPEFYTQWIRENVPAGVGVGWDLYGGAGVFAAAISDRVTVVDSVDTQSHSTHAGEEALRAAGIDNIRFVDGDVESSLEALRSHDGLRVVVLDPPRTGAGNTVVNRIADAQPEYVVHVGCDPATASRDLATWEARGYTVDKLTIVDAFPLTHHVEMLALLTPARD